MEDRFPELAPIHEFGEFQQNTLLLTALSTGDTEERINPDRRRRRGVARSSAGTWSNGGRCLGLVLTAHEAARAPLCRCRRRSHKGGVLRFVFTAAGMATSPLLPPHTSVKISSTGIHHWKVALGGKRKP
jgi:hypothetical protein